MWPSNYWPDSYWGTYWPPSGSNTFPFVPTTGTGNQHLPLLGVGAWLIAMILPKLFP